MSLLEVCEESCHMQHRITSDLKQRLESVVKNHHRLYNHVRCSPPQSLSSIAHAHIICPRYTYCSTSPREYGFQPMALRFE